MDYDNGDFIQNIIYYKCERCNKIAYGEDFMDPDDEESGVYWYSENGGFCQNRRYCYLKKLRLDTQNFQKSRVPQMKRHFVIPSTPPSL